MPENDMTLSEVKLMLATSQKPPSLNRTVALTVGTPGIPGTD